ncbi:MAG: hypothetical protein HY664_06475 [Chloroflexi bacterium]|nr:hypothetical protein [Chloroflexota bacterium]
MQVRAESLILGIALFFFLGLALYQGLRTTADLIRPYDVDLYRDIAQAQTIRDGNLLGDPFFRGETLWYNPLTPALVAGASWLTDLPVPLVYTRLGAYLNLLAPISFYILATYLFDPWIALASTIGFLFMVNGNEPSWAVATYSPWLFSINFVQAFFYLALVAYGKAMTTKKQYWYLLVGVSLGIIFLGHSASALLIAIIIGGNTFQTLISESKHKKGLYVTSELLGNVALILIPALALSFPFLYSIVGQYRLDIQNPAPFRWTYEDLYLSNLGPLFLKNISLVTAIAITGYVAAIYGRSKKREIRLLNFWLAGCVILLAYGYIVEFLEPRGIKLPYVLPPHHFFFYLKALEAMAFGYGLAFVARQGVGILRRVAERIKSEPFSRLANTNKGNRQVVLGLAVLALLFSYPSYAGKGDFTGARLQALEASQRVNEVEAAKWIQKHTKDSDVFAGHDHLIQFVVGVAGRKAMAANPLYANPYVDVAARRADRDVLFAALVSDKQDDLQCLVTKYNIKYVILWAEESLAMGEMAQTILDEAFSEGNIIIYKLRLPETNTMCSSAETS